MLMAGGVACFRVLCGSSERRRSELDLVVVVLSTSCCGVRLSGMLGWGFPRTRLLST